MQSLRHVTVRLFYLGIAVPYTSIRFFCMAPLVPCDDLYYCNSITLMMCTTNGDIRQPTWNHSAKSQLGASSIEEVESFLQRKLDHHLEHGKPSRN